MFEQFFPNLQEQSYQVTSPATPKYNCIAWALGDTNNWWWPDAQGLGFWPESVSREETFASFEQAFETQGFLRCDSSEFQPGISKIALYANGELPTHAARQLENGNWSSKLGPLEDIEHPLEGLEGEYYGVVVAIFSQADQDVRI